MSVLLLPLAVVGVLLLAFTAYQTIFVLAGLPSLRRRAAMVAADRRSTRFVVIIPAHNESELIRGSVTSVLGSEYPPGQRDVIVIADNCTDDTAAQARSAGAICRERHDLELRGKPYALDWQISQLDLTRYDAVVIVDADTVVAPDFLTVMDAHLAAGEQAIQGNIGVLNPDENWLTRLGVLPGSVKFRLHYPGKRAFGLSCPLAGNGMCFSAEMMRRFGWKAFSLTENWEYYVMLALQGDVTMPAPDAHVYTQAARSLALGETQRIRWMSGQFETISRYWRPLLGRGLRELSFVKLDALIEVARPSHANLLFSTLLYIAVCAALLLFGVGRVAPWLFVGIGCALLQAGYFLIGFALERPSLKTWLALLMVPRYLLWKCAVSLKGLISLSDRSWIKTTRN